MTCRMPRFVAGMITLLLVTTGGQTIIGAEETAEPSSKLKLLLETADTKAVMLAVGLSSLSKLKIDSFDIETVWTGTTVLVEDIKKEDDRYLQLLSLETTDLADLATESERLAVMRLWQSDADDRPTSSDSGHLLTASETVPSEVVQELITAIQNNQSILKTANIDTLRLAPSLSMIDEPLPLHQGALAFLGKGLSSNADAPAKDMKKEAKAALPMTPIEKKPGERASKFDGQLFTVYFDTNEAKLDNDDFKSLAEACRYAATLPNARFMITGHTDTVGTEDYNSKLSRKRAESAANAIKNDPRFREALSVLEFGEAKLAVTTADGVQEPKNRRVEITVIQDH